MLGAATKRDYRRMIPNDQVAPTMMQDDVLYELIPHCALRDQSALKALYKHTRPYINRGAYNILRSEELSNDVLQNSFVQIWLNAERYRPKSQHKETQNMTDKQGTDKQGTHNPLDDESLAFEYASGLIRGQERLAFELRLAEEPLLQELLHVWEEQLMHLQDSAPLAPKPDTRAAIEARVSPSQSRNDPPMRWVWALFGAMAAVFVLLVFPVQNPNQNPIDNTSRNTTEAELRPSQIDYVAVMIDENQQAGLTTFGAASDKKLSLHWQLETTKNETKDYQLWAVSKRDGQTRSIAILENGNIQQLQLNDANWRLITDAARLVLTLEEAGGSGIDEPSEDIVASGVCVRIQPQSLPG
ncbi:MAG: anti-sigma-K factor RskA [Patiriisocius sp.]|jgi:anti-sigma-K factor RskA